MTSHMTLCCPECGTTIVPFEEAGTAGSRCTACNWSVVTTNRNHPIWDHVAYSVFASAPALERTKLIALLASELALHIADARALVDAGRPIAQGVNAMDVYRLDRQLRPRGIMLSTQPSFPWPLP